MPLRNCSAQWVMVYQKYKINNYSHYDEHSAATELLELANL